MKFTTQRIAVIVSRSIREKCVKTVFPHEIPCLEAIHGDNSVTLVDGMPEGVKAIDIFGVRLEKVKDDDGYIVERPVLDEDMNPLPNNLPVELDTATEYDALIARYGRHKVVNTSVAEYVFQNNHNNIASFELDEELYAAVNRPAIIEELQKLGVSFNEKDSTDTLAGMLKGYKAAAGGGKDKAPPEPVTSGEADPDPDTGGEGDTAIDYTDHKTLKDIATEMDLEFRGNISKKDLTDLIAAECRVFIEGNDQECPEDAGLDVLVPMYKSCVED